ncbi:MAG: hypothetical protein EXQ69_09415 [Acidimicrobiia bacterium]|nr:hypothetical protein [Acidimicrobiia bacterium]
MKFEGAVALYEVAAHAVATRETIASPGTSHFVTEFNRLRRALDDFDKDATWQNFMRRCRRIQRELTTTPLSPSDPVFEIANSVDYLTSLLDAERGTYPADLLARGDLCAASLRDLSTDESNPLGSAAAAILTSGDLSRSGLVVPSRHLDRIKECLTTAASGIRLITERELSGLVGIESLVVIGPSSLYPLHLLSAPRAAVMCFVYFDWVRDRDRDTRLFPGSPIAPGVSFRSSPSTLVAVPDEGVDAATLVPVVDWDAMGRASSTNGDGSGDEASIVDANQFLLAGGHCVYLEAVEGPKICVINLEPGSKADLRFAETQTIGPDDYIVLRIAGENRDYIGEIADKDMGQDAARLRALQTEWKTLLHGRVRERGFSRVEQELRDLGVTRPYLLYRLAPDSIRTHNRNDFQLLMVYVGIEDRADEMWTAMGKIVNAHKRAGRRVRKLLEKALLETDTQALIQTGWVDVQLQENDAGTLSVFRVEARSPVVTPVAQDDLQVLHRVEPDLWHG